MSDLLDEIKEDLKYERYAQLWQRYGGLFISFLVVIVVGTGLSVWYQNHLQTISGLNGSKLYMANEYLKNGDKREATKIYGEILKDSPASIAALTELNEIYLKIDNFNKAADKSKSWPELLASLKKVQGNTAYPKEYQQLASVIYVTLLLDKNNPSVPDQDKEIISYLNDLSKNSSIWHDTAKEYLGFYYFSQNKLKDSEKIFKELFESKSTPESIKVHAEQMLQTIEKRG